MKKYLLAILLLVVACATWAWSSWRLRQIAPRDIPVLMYHNVLPEGDLSVWQVSVGEFARQMDQLAEAGFTTILPEDIWKAAHGRGGLPEKPVVITFDDGYEGVAVHAEPILAAHGFKAICYAIMGRLSGEDAERAVFDSGPLLTTNELVAMAARGVVSVGSHSMTHARQNPRRLASEMGPSRELLARLGVKTFDYCYPFGLYGYDYMYENLEKSGYRTALVCDDRMFHYGTDTNLFAIPRVSVYGGSHDVSVRSVDADAGEIVLANDGDRLPLQVVVRDNASGRTWKSELLSVSRGHPRTYAFPSEALRGPRSIEAWDKFGIFRYYP